MTRKQDHPRFQKTDRPDKPSKASPSTHVMHAVSMTQWSVNFLKWIFTQHSCKPLHCLVSRFPHSQQKHWIARINCTQKPPGVNMYWAFVRTTPASSKTSMLAYFRLPPAFCPRAGDFVGDLPAALDRYWSMFSSRSRFSKKRDIFCPAAYSGAVGMLYCWQL